MVQGIKLQYLSPPQVYTIIHYEDLPENFDRNDNSGRNNKLESFEDGSTHQGRTKENTRKMEQMKKGVFHSHCLSEKFLQMLMGI